jgi:hypothetical protein
MIDPTALEAAARAIFNGSPEEWDALTCLHQLVFHSQAKAAVTAYQQAAGHDAEIAALKAKVAELEAALREATCT